jgi:hypothetical protein
VVVEARCLTVQVALEALGVVAAVALIHFPQRQQTALQIEVVVAAAQNEMTEPLVLMAVLVLW